MILLPAIDLMNGQVVRLRQGRAEEKVVYSDDPAAFARKWQDEGGHYLHVVDLDAAFTGEQKNLKSVEAIVAALEIPCELGGGIRDAASVRRALDTGVSRVIIGTRAAESIDAVRELVAEFGGEKIAVGIDAKDGMVAVKGWVESSGITAHTLAKEVEAAGVRTIIYTDIAKDGMLQGPNFEAIRAMHEASGCDIVASGGISCNADVLKLNEIEGLYGTILGKALYDDLADLRTLRDAMRM